MKFLILFIFSIFSFSICLSQNFEQNRLVVYGSAEQFTQADFANFSFEVIGYGSSLSLAVQNAKKQVNIISSKLFKTGLTEKNLITSFFHSAENYGDKAFLSSKKDYKANITVRVQIDSLSLLEPAIIAISESQPEKISTIDFSLRNYEKLKEKVLEKAILKAKDKANILASNMNTELGDILYIEEFPTYPQYRLRRPAPSPFNVAYESKALTVEQGSSSESGFFAEEIALTARVKVIIELVKGGKS